MKVVAAYLLAVLGGNASPCADDLKDILGSGTAAVDYFHICAFVLTSIWLIFFGLVYDLNIISIS